MIVVIVMIIRLLLLSFCSVCSLISCVMFCVMLYNVELVRNSMIVVCSMILWLYRLLSLLYSGSMMVDDSRYVVMIYDNWLSLLSLLMIVGSVVDMIVWLSVDSSMMSSSVVMISLVGVLWWVVLVVGGVRRVLVVIEVFVMVGKLD